MSEWTATATRDGRHPDRVGRRRRVSASRRQDRAQGRLLGLARAARRRADPRRVGSRPCPRSSISSSSWPRSRARPARSATSPTACSRTSATSGSSPTRTAPAATDGWSMGNVYARAAPTAAGEPIFLCAHLDTVPPTDAIEPVVEDGVVRNARPAILGSDNKAAVAAMLEATRRVLAEGRPHAGIELVFTPKEEIGLLGAFAFDHRRLDAHVGYVYDQAAPIGDVILGAPSAQQLEITFHGRAAHAGMYPEDGPLRDRRRRARDLRDAARPDRRGDDREHRRDLRRHRRERRPGVVPARRRRPLPRRAEARRRRPVDPGRGHVRRRRRRGRGRDES